MAKSLVLQVMKDNGLQVRDCVLSLPGTDQAVGIARCGMKHTLIWNREVHIRPGGIFSIKVL